MTARLFGTGKVHDGCGCYSLKDGSCFCAECYYYGYDAVNCADVPSSEDWKKSKPVKWDKDQKKWVVIPKEDDKK